MTLADFLPVFLTISAIGLVVSLSTEQSQIVAKTRGVIAGKIATGYMNSMRVMIINRFGSILYIFFLGLSIDVGIANQTLLTVAIVSGTGVLGYNLMLIYNRAKILMFTNDVNDERLWGFMVHGGCWYTTASYLATLCNVLGLTLPLLLSNSFPEYRLSMANTGFLLNAFFTLINVLILETRYAVIVDNGTHQEAYRFSVLIFVTRAMATVTAIIVFSALWFLLAPS